MQNQLNELKQKMLEFFQLVKSKINHKKSEKVSEEKQSDGTGGKVLAILGSILV
ncbi:MAG: Penicillin-binding protein 1B, partial [Streptococcus sp. DORA_10]